MKQILSVLLAALLLAMAPAALADEHQHTLVNKAPKAASCTETGLTTGTYCEDCGEVIVPQETIPATGHDYSAAPVFQWEDGAASCYVVFTCGNDATHARVADAEIASQITKAPTKTEMGETTYTASLTLDGVLYTDVLVLQDIPAEVDVPNTGDGSALALWTVLLMVSCAGLFMLVKQGRFNQ